MYKWHGCAFVKDSVVTWASVHLVNTTAPRSAGFWRKVCVLNILVGESDPRSWASYLHHTYSCHVCISWKWKSKTCLPDKLKSIKIWKNMAQVQRQYTAWKGWMQWLKATCRFYSTVFLLWKISSLYNFLHFPFKLNSKGFPKIVKVWSRTSAGGVNTVTGIECFRDTGLSQHTLLAPMTCSEHEPILLKSNVNIL